MDNLKKAIASTLGLIPEALFIDPLPFRDYIHLAEKIVKIKYFNAKIPVYGSADITNRCNLRCKHCYWWKGYQKGEELSPDEWRTVINEIFIKNHIFHVALTGGEPLLRPDVVEVFTEELPHKIFIVTNGTIPLMKLSKVGGYYVSVDGTEEIHDRIRGKGVYAKVKRNVKEYDGAFYTNTTLTTINYKCVEELVEEWHGSATMMNFQFHTPFSYDDKLWIPFGKTRNEIVDKLLKLKEKYPSSFLNTEKQLELLRSDIWTKECPAWATISLDHRGKRKSPCCIAGEKAKPICDRCGMAEQAGFYAGIKLGDLEWFEILKAGIREFNKKKVNHGYSPAIVFSSTIRAQCH